MRNLIASLSLALATGASAQPLAHMNASRMTCAQVHQQLASDGEIVLTYGSKYQYNRFVSGDGMCKGHLIKSYVASVPTRDKQKCSVRICDYSR